MTLRPAAQRVQEALRARGLDAEVIEFAESTRTSAEAAAAIGCEVAQIAKSLVFTVAGAPVLVIASGANRVDTAKLAEVAGGPVERADAETVRRATGFAIGGVPPVAHATPLPVYIDRDLLTLERIYAAAGTPHAVFPLTPDDLVRVTGGRVVDLAAK
ncbi:MAG TPA: YbaK/EbsC family protein [Thermodesulfobacteriota bacterium]